MARGQADKTRRGAVAALLAALSLVLLYLAALAPSGRLGVVALAGLVPAAAVVSAGWAAGVLCYAAAGLLGLLLLPDKGLALLYLIFFGLYPLLKSPLERLNSRVLEWAGKLACFNLALALFWFVLGAVFLPLLPGMLRGSAWLAFLAGNVIFAAYDYGFSRLISFYMARIDPALRRRG